MNNDLKFYFDKAWKPNYNKFIYSGWNLIKKINDDETILDVGCGFNLFKPYFKDRLYGIDIVNKFADEIVSIEDFVTNKTWNVGFCLGSLNFGTNDQVYEQVKKVCKLTERIYFRQNPGVADHKYEGVEKIKFFPWTINLNYEWAERNNFTVKEIKWDKGNRIYSEWIKN
jgi:hypothetical protein